MVGRVERKFHVRMFQTVFAYTDLKFRVDMNFRPGIAGTHCTNNDEDEHSPLDEPTQLHQSRWWSSALWKIDHPRAKHLPYAR